MENFYRIFLATVICILSIIPAYYAIVFFSGDIENQLLHVGAISALLMAAVFVVFIGIPFHIILSKRKIFKAKPYLIIGFLAPLFFVALNYFFVRIPIFDNLYSGLILGACGCFLAWVFWYIAVKLKNHSQSL